MSGRVVVAGGTGFVGRALVAHLEEIGYEVTVLTTSSAGADPRFVPWDGRTLGEWAGALEGARALINLSGSSINVLWTPENRKRILSSRVDSTRTLGTALARASSRPPLWINASAIGFYGDTGQAEATENSPPGAGFLGETCRAWEAAVDETCPPGVRAVKLRIGIVLGPDGGILQPLARLTRLYLGGSIGKGTHWVSWIHRTDLVRMASWLFEEPLSGPLNAVAPYPVQNREFMAELRRVLGRPWSPPAPSFAAALGARLMGTEPALATVSQRVRPHVALDRGFEFRFPTLASALEEIYGSARRAQDRATRAG